MERKYLLKCIFPFLRSGDRGKARRWVLPLNQHALPPAEHPDVRDIAWSWFILFIFNWNIQQALIGFVVYSCSFCSFPFGYEFFTSHKIFCREYIWWFVFLNNTIDDTFTKQRTKLSQQTQKNCVMTLAAEFGKQCVLSSKMWNISLSGNWTHNLSRLQSQDIALGIVAEIKLIFLRRGEHCFILKWMK